MNTDETLVDPMEQLTSDIDTSYPLLPAKLYTLQITKAEKKEVKRKAADDTPLFQIAFTFSTMEGYKSTAGRDLPKGHSITHYVGITPFPEREEDGKTKRAYAIDDIKRNLSAICQSAGFVTTVKALIETPSYLVGKYVRANVTIDEDKNKKFPPSNRISSFEKVK